MRTLGCVKQMRRVASIEPQKVLGQYWACTILYITLLYICNIVLYIYICFLLTTTYKRGSRCSLSNKNLHHLPL